MKFTLTKNGETKTLAEWGFQGVQRSTSNQDDYSVTFTHLASADAPLMFGYYDDFTITADPGAGAGSSPQTWFIGVIVEAERILEGKQECVRYKAEHKAWNQLSRLIFQQEWITWSGSGTGTILDPRTHIFLGQKIVGTLGQWLYQNVGEQITEIVTWAKARGIDMDVSVSAGMAVNFPLIESRELKCTEAIRETLKYAPDSFVWFDDSGARPVMHVCRRSELQVIALPFVGGDLPGNTNFKARHDLQYGSVVIRYEKANVVDGNKWVEIIKDVYPPGSSGLDMDCAPFTIDLQGMNITHAYADLTCNLIDAASSNASTRNAWWAAKQPELAAADVSSFSIDLASVTRKSNLPNELADGQFAPWMFDPNEPDPSKQLKCEQDVIVCKAAVIMKDGTAKVKQLAVNLSVTNADTGRYSSDETVDWGEPVPVGLAQAFYEAANHLFYEGGRRFVGQDVSLFQWMGKAVNVIGGPAEWETMETPVVRVEDNLDDGSTTIHCGPSKHLGLGDMVELWRRNNRRVIVTSPNARVTGMDGSSGRVELGDKLSKADSTAGTTGYQSIAIPATKDQNGALVTGIQLNKDDCLVTVNGVSTPIKVWLQETIVSDSNCAPQKCLVLRSAPY